jgi:hypothetical protein
VRWKSGAGSWIASGVVTTSTNTHPAVNPLPFLFMEMLKPKTQRAIMKGAGLTEADL